MINTAVPVQPKRIRVSSGTADVLGLQSLRSAVEPTTAYLMTYTLSGCQANCAFCPQARESSSSRDRLSRVIWPDYPLELVLARFKPMAMSGKLQRICIQTLNYRDFLEDVSEIVSAILSKTRVPISVSCPPIERDQMVGLRELGVDRIGIPIDGATPEIFDKIKGESAGGPYRWESHLAAIRDALSAFGVNRVTTHFIIGLGESERDVVQIIQNLHDMGVNSSLFAFTPVKGTKFEKSKRPDIGHYRRIQLARYLVVQGFSSLSEMSFDGEKRITDFGIDQKVIEQIVLTGNPFMTAGCDGCNRPFYTESPRGPIYNYPRPLTRDESCKGLKELQIKNGE